MTNPKDIKDLSNISRPPAFVLQVAREYLTETAKVVGERHGLNPCTVVRWGRRINGPKQTSKTTPDPPMEVTLAAWEEANHRVYLFAKVLGVGRERGAGILGRAEIEYTINGKPVAYKPLDPGVVRCSICEFPVFLGSKSAVDAATPDGRNHKTCVLVKGKIGAILYDDL